MTRHTALLLLPVLLLLVLPSVWAWAYDGWNYRMPITITDTSGTTLTDYQVKLTVDTASLIAAGKMNADCSDMRFATSDDQPIPYWIESGCGTSETIVWVKVPSIPANGDTTIYMYYGNPNATSESDGDMVFEGYIDCHSAVNTSYANVTTATYDSKCVLSITPSDKSKNNVVYASTSSAIESPVIIDMHAIEPNPAQGDQFAPFLSAVASGFDSSGHIYSAYYSGIGYMDSAGKVSKYIILKTSPTGSESQIASLSYEYYTTVWHVYSMSVAGGAVCGYIDGTKVTCASDSAYTSFYRFGIVLDNEDSTKPVYIEWIRVRKYAASEPTATFGKEELPLPYWIEPDASGNPAKVWVKIPSIPANGSITIYARKETGFQPNGDAVFEFFDDFTGTSLDTSKWVVDPNNIGATSVTISNGELIVGGSAKGRVATVSTWTQAVFEARVKVSDESGSSFAWEIAPNNMMDDGYWTMFGVQYNKGKVIRFYDNGVLEDVTRNTSLTAYQRVSFYYNAGTIQRVVVGTDDVMRNFTQIADPLHFNVYVASGYTVYVDRVFVRKYAPQDPTVTVTDAGDYYKITISNPNSTDLTDFQISIPASDLGVTSTTESIHFSDQLGVNVGVSVTLTHSPTTQSDLALDPENNVTSVTVDYNAVFNKTNVSVTYWRAYDGDTNTTLLEGNQDVNYITFSRTYDAIGDYNTCVYVEAVDDQNNEYNDTTCDTVHIDQYPQNLQIEWDMNGLKIPFPSEDITFTGSATDNGTLTYEWIFPKNLYVPESDVEESKCAEGSVASGGTSLIGEFHVPSGGAVVHSITIPIYSSGSFNMRIRDSNNNVVFETSFTSAIITVDKFFPEGTYTIQTGGSSGSLHKWTTLPSSCNGYVEILPKIGGLYFYLDYYTNVVSGETSTAKAFSSGTYTVTMTVTDDAGLSKSTSVSVPVYVAPTFDFNANPVIEGTPVGFIHHVDPRLAYLCSVIADNNKIGDCGATYVPAEVTNGLYREDTITVQYSLSDGNNTRDYNVSNALHVDALVLGECNANVSTVALEYGVYDESTRDKITDTNFTLTVDLTYTNDTNTIKHHFGGVFSANELNLCVYPDYATFYLDGHVDYTADGYPLRSYFYSSAHIIDFPQTVRLYALPSTDGSYLSIYVQSGTQYVQGALVRVLRYYPSTATYETVASGFTDYEGKVVVFVRPTDAYYKYVVTYGGQTEEFGPVVVTSTTTTLNLNRSGTSYEDIVGTISVSCNYNKDTNGFVCSYNDPTGQVVKARLVIHQLTVLSPALVYDQTIEGPAGSFAVALDPSHNYDYYLYVYMGGQWYVLTSDVLYLSKEISVFGMEGPVLAFIVTVAIAFTGLITPLLAVVMATIGVAVSALFGLVPLGIGSIVGLLAAGVIAVFRRGSV